MKRFTDRAGREWDVVVGRESWGALLALFTPVSRGGATLQAPLRAESLLAAERELDSANDARLQDLLDRAQPKNE